MRLIGTKMIGYKKHLRETESLKIEDWQRFSNLPKTSEKCGATPE